MTDSEPGWVGFDLDGTLAATTDKEIGPLVPAMAAILREHFRAGVDCRIFTARAQWHSEQLKVQAWLQQHGLPVLRITNVKDDKCFQIWDDRAVSVGKNTGEVLSVRYEVHPLLQAKNSHLSDRTLLRLVADGCSCSPDKEDLHGVCALHRTFASISSEARVGSLIRNNHIWLDCSGPAKSIWRLTEQGRMLLAELEAPTATTEALADRLVAALVGRPELLAAVKARLWTFDLLRKGDQLTGTDAPQNG